MKWFGIIAMTLLMTMSGCKQAMGTQYRECFENDDAVSLKDMIDVYDKYASAKETVRTLTCLLPSMERKQQTIFLNTRL